MLLWTLHHRNCTKFKSEHKNQCSEMFCLKGNCSKYFLIQAINHMTGTLQCLNSTIYRLCCYTRPQKAVKTTTRALHHSTNVFPKSSVKSELIFWLMWHKDITAECLSCHTRQLWFCKSTCFISGTPTQASDTSCARRKGETACQVQFMFQHFHQLSCMQPSATDLCLLSYPEEKDSEREKDE